MEQETKLVEEIGIPDWLNPDVMLESALEEKDPGIVFVTMGNHEHLPFLFEHWWEFKEAGIYEDALLEAYTGCKSNWHSIPIDIIEYMFENADRDKLLSAGDSLPGDGPYTVYRGVAGTGAARRVRGFSWTSDFEKAKWFANRFKVILNKPMVYEATVEKDMVLAYSNSRDEQEFLCQIPKDLPLKRVWG